MRRSRRQNSIARRLAQLGLLVVLAGSGPGCRAPRPEAGSRAGLAAGLASIPGRDEPARSPTPPGRAPTDGALARVDHATEGDHRVGVSPPPDAEPPAPEGVLTLPDAVGYGLRHNPRLAQLQAQVVEAREGVNIAFAPFLPTVQFNEVFAAYNVPILPGGAFVAASIQRGTFAYNLAEANVQATLIDFGRRTGRYNQAIGRAGVEALLLDRARQTVAYDVATAYFALLQAMAQERVLEEAARRAGEFRRDAGSRGEGGTIDRESVLRSDVDVSRAGEGLVAGRQAIMDADALLNQALGRACATPIAVVDVGRRPDLCDSRDDCLRRAAETRPEIATAREEIGIAARGVQIARGATLPRIYVNASLIQADLEGVLDRLVEGIGLNIDQTLFAGGARVAGIRQAKAGIRAAAAGLRVILDNVSTEVNLAYNALTTDRERVRLTATTVRQARENLRVVVVRFNNGDAIPTEVIDAQTALTAAEVRYYNAAYGYLANLARLDYAQGGDLGPLVAAVMVLPTTPDERISLPRDEPGDAAMPAITPPPEAPPPVPPALDLPAALPDRPA